MLRALRQTSRNVNSTPLPFYAFYATGESIPHISHNSYRWNSSGTIAQDSEAILAASTFNKIWLSISDSRPVGLAQEGLVFIHDCSGVPWWATIILSTVLLRSIITLPLTIYQQKISSRLELLTMQMPTLVNELKREAAQAKHQFNWTEEQTKRVFQVSLKKQWNKLIVRDNCHPMKMFIVLFGQIPLWVCQSVALRNLVSMLPDPTSVQSQVTYAELTVGGFAWIPNLTEVDNSYLLPIGLGLINLTIIEVQTAVNAHLPRTTIQKFATNAFRCLSILMVPVACTVPSALCVYWTSSSAYGLAQNLLLVSPAVRRLVGIPITKSEIQKPYTYLGQMLKKRLPLTSLSDKNKDNKKG